MLRIGLTGGIGAGKSTVSRTLADCGAVVIDSDKIAREVVEPGTEGLAALVERFGSEIVDDEGVLIRSALATVAFGDEESTRALNGILHPLIGARTSELMAEAPADCVLVHDIPLLVESRSAAAFHMVIVVHVEEDERIRRLVESRGIAEADARSRIAAQATDEQRRVAADVWLENSGTPDELEARVRALWSERLVPFRDNLRTRTVARTLPSVVDPDPTWPDQARRLIERLALACGERAVRIDHIGSTAVPDFPAKDVLDIQITVRDMETADALRDPLTEATFPRIDRITSDEPKAAYPGESDPSVWEKRLHGTADPGRTANIHIRVEGWPGQQSALMFRDWLRAEPEVRIEYLEIKRRAAAAVVEPADYAAAIEAYVDAKAPWMDSAYERCLEWARRTGWSAGE